MRDREDALRARREDGRGLFLGRPNIVTVNAAVDNRYASMRFQYGYLCLRTLVKEGRGRESLQERQRIDSENQQDQTPGGKRDLLIEIVAEASD